MFESRQEARARRRGLAAAAAYPGFMCPTVTPATVKGNSVVVTSLLTLHSFIRCKNFEMSAIVDAGLPPCCGAVADAFVE